MKLPQLLIVSLQVFTLSFSVISSTIKANILSIKTSKSSYGVLEHFTQLYFDNDGNMTDRYMDIIINEPNFAVKDILYSAHDIAIRNMNYSFGKSFIPTDGSKKVGLIDCTHLIAQIFLRAGLPYEYVSTIGMVKKYPTAKKYYDYISPVMGTKNSFKPKTGDILAYYRNNKGHAVMVIDPKKCMAINATTWNWTQKADGTNFRNPNDTGVFFQEVKEGKCENGVWTSWDNAYNKFQVHLRHKEIVAAEPTNCPIDSDSEDCSNVPSRTSLLIPTLRD